MVFNASWVHTHMLERPRRVPIKFRSTVQRMLDELEGNRLDVVCTPSIFPEIACRGGMIRTVQSRNTDWYRDYCSGWTSSRKRPRTRKLHDTRIKRRETVYALRGLLGEGTRSPYANDLLKTAMRWRRLWVAQDREQAAYYRRMVKERTKTKPFQPVQQEMDDYVPF